MACLNALEEHYSMGLATDRARCPACLDALAPPDANEARLVSIARAAFEAVARTGTPREIQRVSKLDPETGALLALDLIVMNTELEQVWATRTTFHAGKRRMTEQEWFELRNQCLFEIGLRVLIFEVEEFEEVGRFKCSS